MLLSRDFFVALSVKWREKEKEHLLSPQTVTRGNTVVMTLIEEILAVIKA